MLNQTAVKADFQLIFREPILIIFMILPLFIISIVKLLITYGVPLLFQYTGFDLRPYYGYVLAMALLMAPLMLGTVCGFLMIDDRDARIFELMSVTPLGYPGYIIMRSLIPFSAAFIYTIIGYYLIDIYHVNLSLLIYTAFLNSLSGVFIGLFLFAFAGDKVKGVTYSKGLSMLNVLAAAGPEAIVAVPALIRRLSDERSDVVVAACQALIAIGPVYAIPAIGDLVDLLLLHTYQTSFCHDS